MGCVFGEAYYRIICRNRRQAGKGTVVFLVFSPREMLVGGFLQFALSPGWLLLLALFCSIA